jgi:crotonobetainyl-CoA:carnitine CoA-transferase CaiB-like acyl-CoA transferase
MQILTSLWAEAGLSPTALEMIRLTGSEPALPSSFAIGTAAQATIAAAALAAAEVWRLQTGRWQQVSVEMRHAAIEFRSERYLRVDGRPAPEHRDKITGAYQCGDGHWVRIHANFPHHRDGVLALLHCAHDPGAVQGALQHWTAEEFETSAAEAGLVTAALRTFTEWDEHPQATAVARLPLVAIEKIGDAAPEMPRASSRPLQGVHVLDLTRVIAGPVCGRTLAAHGADVLLVTAPHLASMESLVIDTGRGKLSAHIDLRHPAGRETLEGLLRQSHVFVQSYRPGALQHWDFGPEAAARIRPGIVYVSLSAYGHEGPWANRRGFDSLVQTATGFNHAEAEAAGTSTPKPLPAQALDHASGYLMAFGAMAALQRRALEGGSWHVRISLAGTGRWLRHLGRIADGLACPDPTFKEVSDYLENTPSGFGQLTAVRHAAQLAETPPRWTRPSVPLGTDAAEWPE